MAKTEEDILLREVEDDLKKDQATAFLRQYGGWLAGAAALIVVGVGTHQVWSRADISARTQAAEAYRSAVVLADADPEASREALTQVAAGKAAGYAALANLRLAGVSLGNDDRAAAYAALDAVVANPRNPARLRDLARLRLASLVLDEDPARARALAGAVTLPAFSFYAQEIEAVAALAAGDFEAAYARLSALAAGGDDVPPGLKERATILAPVADAGRRGVSLTPAESEADAFIRSFGEALERDQAAAAAATLPVPDEALGEASGDTP